MKHYLGIDVGGTKIAYGLFDADKKLIAKWKHPTDTSLQAPDFFNDLCDNAYSFTNKNGIPLKGISGIGIGVPSFVCFQSGHIVKTGSIPLINDFPAKQYLRDKLGNIPIVLDNDGNTGALAELRHGVGRGFDHLVFCLISTGIGSGLVINRTLFRGSYGWAGESGHMLINPGMEYIIPAGSCGCGNEGCLNAMCSGKMIIHHVRHWLQNGEKSIIADMSGGMENITAQHIGEAYRLGDPLAIRAVEQMSYYIAIWLYNIYVLLNINRFVFSGGLLEMGDIFLTKIEEQFHQYNKSNDTVYFLKTKLDCDAGIIGAMELLFNT